MEFSRDWALADCKERNAVLAGAKGDEEQEKSINSSACPLYIPAASLLCTSNPAGLISYNCYAFPTIRLNLSTTQKDPPPLSYHSNVTATALWIQILHLRDRRSLPRANSFHTEQHRKPPERPAFYS